MLPVLLSVFLQAKAHAEMPLPSYKDDLSLAAWHSVNNQIEAACAVPAGSVEVICNPAMLSEAIEEAKGFQTTLFPSARLEYLIGLACRYQGQEQQALHHYNNAIKLDPERQDAWHDLGEMYLVAGKYAKAREAFGHVARLVDRGKLAWIGPWRLAEISAHEGDTDRFESEMKEALRRGFSFRQIIGLENWRRFYADPRMHDSIEKLVTVYGNSQTLDFLEGRQEKTPQ